MPAFYLYYSLLFFPRDIRVYMLAACWYQHYIQPVARCFDTIEAFSLLLLSNSIRFSESVIWGLMRCHFMQTTKPNATTFTAQIHFNIMTMCLWLNMRCLYAFWQNAYVNLVRFLSATVQFLQQLLITIINSTKAQINFRIGHYKIYITFCTFCTFAFNRVNERIICNLHPLGFSPALTAMLL